MCSSSASLGVAFIAVLLLCLGGCLMPEPEQPTSVSQAWQRSRARSPAPRSAPVQGEAVPVEQPIATVDGIAIGRDRVIELLLAGRGVSVLDELIVLELARREASARDLTVSKPDVDAEYDRALRSLVNSLPSAEPAALDADAAEQILDQVLDGRGISRQEYRLGVLRNAYLRKLAAADLKTTEQQLRDEYERAYGERVSVRHIQLAAGADLAEVQRLLAAGADFAELARGRSANLVTAGQGGLLAPFCRHAPDVPVLLREAAFALAPGQVSNPVRIDNWYHIIKVEQRIPPVGVSFDEVSSRLRDRLRERLLPAEMQRISAELFSRARIEINDSALETDFFERHPELGRAGR